MLREKTYDALIAFGVNPRSHGLYYIIEAVEMFEPELKAMELYRLIGQRHGKTPELIERAIRYSFNQMDFKSEEVGEFFGGKKFTNIGYISILHFKLSRGY